MKHLFNHSIRLSVLGVALVLGQALQAQIPNWSFESWTDHNKDIPSGWTAFGGVAKSSPGAGGNFCALLQADSGMQQSDPIGAILYGTPSGQGMNFEGGIPFAARPDSIRVNVKHDIAAGDSAWVLVFFKKNGTYLSMDIFRLTGTQSTFTTRSFAINYMAAGTPDSLIIGFTSGSPMSGSPNPANKVWVDDVSFSGTTLTVPNADLETWTVQTTRTPDGWFTSNNPQFATVTRSTDAVSGNYSIKLENNISGGDTMQGYAVTSRAGMPPWWFGPAFPVGTVSPDTLHGWYKFAPQNGDSCLIQVNLFHAGAMVGYGFFTTGAAASSFTPFKCVIQYGPDTLPDSAAITLTSFYMSMGGGRPKGNSALWVENLDFGGLIHTGMSNVISPVRSINTYPNPMHSKGTVEVTVSQKAHVRMQIFDLAGKMVMHVMDRNLDAGDYGFTIDVSSLSPGMYVLRTENGSSVSTSKLQVTH